MSWGLTESGFESLLAALDPDRDRAAERLAAIRARLVKFFEWRGCSDALEQADRTIDRVARRLGEGAHITTADPSPFFYGVAVNVLKEHWRSPERQAEPLAAADPSGMTTDDHERAAARLIDREEYELRLDCLARCLASFPPESRSLITRYHLDATRDCAGARRALAASLGIPLNALRIRAFRLRQALEACVMKCQRESVMTDLTRTDP